MLQSYRTVGIPDIRYYTAIMLPSNRFQWELIQGGIICKNDAFRWGLFGFGGFFEDLQ